MTSLGPITDPQYRLLIELLSDRTGSPLTLTTFRDVFLPQYDSSGHLSNLLQFHQWYNTYREYFLALPEFQQYRSPPPDSQAPAEAGEDPLPYRTEVDCALAHYLSSGRFSDATRSKVMKDAQLTTHPDIFVPMTNEVHFALLPAAKVFLTKAANNLSPASRMVRIVLATVALLLGIATISFCAATGAMLWWRAVPLPWMTIAWIYLVSALWKLDCMRYFFGLTERGLVEEWVGVEKSSRRHRVIVVEDEWIVKEQRWRMCWIYGLGGAGTVCMWVLSLIL